METPIENKPVESLLKRNIEESLLGYNAAKSILWVESKKDNSTTAQESYNYVLQSLEELLENTKADNAANIAEVLRLQNRVEELSVYTGEVDEAIITEIKNICAFVDTKILRPYLATLHPILNI